jgi:hypothetical protein
MTDGGMAPIGMHLIVKTPARSSECEGLGYMYLYSKKNQ